jgi:MFS family permease
VNKFFSRELILVIGIVGLAVLAMSLLQPMLPLYLTSIDINPAVLGLMFSVGMVGLALGESSGGWLADKIGIKLPMLIGTFLCAPLVLSFVFAHNTALIFVVFFFWGIFRAAVFGPGRGYIGTHVPVSHRATFMAIYATAMAISRGMGTFTSGFVVDAWGYPWVFYLATGVAIFGGLLVLAGLRVRNFRNSPQATIPDTDEPATKPLDLYRQGNFITQCIVAALYFTAIGVLPFLSLLASQVAGLTAAQVGILFTVSAVVSAVFLIPMGRLADRQNKKIMMALGLLITAMSLAGIAFSRSFAALAAYQVLGSLGGSMFGPAAVALLSENVPSGRQNTAMGIYGGSEDAGMIIGSALGGLLWSSLGPTSTFLIAGTAAAFLGSVISILFLKKPIPRSAGSEQFARS